MLLPAMSDLSEIIRREMQGSGFIPFARFMELSLYCPDSGYYEQLTNSPGRRGDFYTSVNVGGLFGELLAFQFASWLGESGLEKFQLLEAGAHDGQLAQDVLNWFESRRPDLFGKLEYWILEPSPRRQQWQKTSLDRFAARVRWFDSWERLPLPGVQGIIFSNELLDAMPVHRVAWNAREKKWFEWAVAWEAGKFVWQKRPIDSTLREQERGAPARRGAARRDLADLDIGAPIPGSMVSAHAEKREEAYHDAERRPPVRREPQEPFCDRASPRPGALIPGFALDPAQWERLLSALPDNFTTEFSPAAAAWWLQAASSLKRGHLLTFDYSLSAEEFFLPHRANGTLRAYHRHRLSDDLLANVGQQDLTAHVNSTALQQSGEQAGLKTEGLLSQAEFLTPIAGSTWKPGSDFGEWTANRKRQFQTLTHPEHLGRAFKVLWQSRR
jgi:SAM-dependent MidA family methyltransferase